ncbi:MAG: beta-ketoacyl synthase N-terminal-like domain-containing protein [Chitinophagaceae bacterium]
MREVFIVADNILSPVGDTSDENFARLQDGVSGIKEHHHPATSAQPFYASLFNSDVFSTENNRQGYTKFEQMLIASVSGALADCDIEATENETVFIVSTTKGNIGLLENSPYTGPIKDRVALPRSAKLVAGHFKFINQPIVVSNACISGLLALLTGMRLIQSGRYEHAVVAGADVVSQFVLSGFQSFQAISAQPCKPFDAERNGLTLGEGAGTIILSARKKDAASIRLAGGSVSNDANHISGPSRTGEELFHAIHNAMQDADVSSTCIDFISAHGTATIYNDEMEAKAFNLANLQTVPVNSLKGYFGHTLGAAGIIECVVSCQSLKHNLVLPTLGFHNSGVSKPLNICNRIETGIYNNCLKTASGFGGCNAAVVLRKQ